MITFRRYPEVVLLQRPEEEDTDVVKLSYKEILLRWIRFMNVKDHAHVEVNNLAKDLADCTALGHVFNGISQNGLSGDYFSKQPAMRAQ